MNPTITPSVSTPVSVPLSLPVCELRSALTGLNKVMVSRATLPVLGCLCLAQEPGASPSDRPILTLQATDLENHVTYRFNDAGTKASFPPVLIPAEPLQRLVKTLPAQDQLTITRSGPESVTLGYQLAGKAVEQSVKILLPQEWPPEPLISRGSQPADARFKTALLEALECSSQDSSRHVLQGAYVDLNQKSGHYLVGTDGCHLYSANSFHLDLAQSIIVPQRRFLSWNGFTNDGEWTVATSPGNDKHPGWIRLDSGHWRFITKLIDGNFPNWRQVVPDRDRSKTTSVTLDSEAAALLLSVLPRLPGAHTFNQPVRLVVRDQQLLLQGREEEKGDWTEIPVPGVQVDGRSIHVRLNRNFVLKALRFGLRQLEIADGKSPLVFRDGGRTMVIMPMGEERDVPSKGQSKNPTPPPAEATPESSTAATAPTTTTTTPTTTTPSVPAAEAVPENHNNPNQTPTQGNQTMSTTTNNPSTLTPPERGNLRAHAPEESAFKAALQQLDQIKTKLRDLVGDITEAGTLLRAAEKEQRGVNKEIESVRAKLREIQSVAI